jgi:hypothetical protein
MVGQVRSQVIFHKPQQVSVRCEASNERGLRRRDVKLVSSSMYLKIQPNNDAIAIIEEQHFIYGDICISMRIIYLRGCIYQSTYCN